VRQRRDDARADTCPDAARSRIRAATGLEAVADSEGEHEREQRDQRPAGSAESAAHDWEL
jgi:hypothetical protein